MKKIATIGLLISVIFLGYQGMGQTETKKDAAAASRVTMTSKVAASEGERFYDQTGRLMASMDKDGILRDTQGRILGTYTSDGEYLNPYGEKVGYVENGTIRKADGKVFATIREDGRVYDGKKQFLGTIADDGSVLNSRGVRMGSAPGLDKSVVALMYFFPKSAPMPEIKKAEDN